MNDSIDIREIVAVYEEKIAELTHENVFLKARLRTVTKNEEAQEVPDDLKKEGSL